MDNFNLEVFVEFFNSPRVQMLSEIDQRRYMMLFGFAVLQTQVRNHNEVAFQMRISSEELELTKDCLIDAGLIDDNFCILGRPAEKHDEEAE